jgi:SAM-dependent methyltransferase
MSPSINPELLALLACPECGGNLGLSSRPAEGPASSPDAPVRAAADLAGCEESLLCAACGRSFGVRKGVPRLYPDDIDRAHIEEEEKLAELMATHTPSGREILYEAQWAESKKEFWGFVKERASGGNLSILNAGCGIDGGFFDLEGAGTLVAFDLMPSLLERLGAMYGSKHNVAGAVQALPFREGSFDCICCVDLVHHEPERLPDIIRSFHRVLKPGGALFLEDINAWGLFQFWKSIFLPAPVHGALRSAYHAARRSPHRPADYEFPTSVWRVKKLLAGAGFMEIEAVPQRAYPNTGPAGLAVYRALSRFDRVRRYHNFHYMLFAVK